MISIVILSIFMSALGGPTAMDIGGGIPTTCSVPAGGADDIGGGIPTR